MSKARKKAREVLYQAYEDPSAIGRAKRIGVGADCADEQADIISDVWEPLLRDLLIAYKHAIEFGGKGHTLDTTSVFAWGGYIRAKEALDD